MLTIISRHIVDAGQKRETDSSALLCNLFPARGACHQHVEYVISTWSMSSARASLRYPLALLSRNIRLLSWGRSLNSKQKLVKQMNWYRTIPSDILKDIAYISVAASSWAQYISMWRSCENISQWFGFSCFPASYRAVVLWEQRTGKWKCYNKSPNKDVWIFRLVSGHSTVNDVSHSFYK